MTQLTADLVIVGAGMVGATLAAALADSGKQILLLEQRETDLFCFPEEVTAQQKVSVDPRVSALTCASQQILSHIGAWQEIEQRRCSPYTDMDVWDGEGTGHIHFSSRELHEPALGHIVENRVTLAALYGCLQRCENVQLLSNVTVNELEQLGDRRLVVLDDGRVIETPLVVAADGAFSAVRKMAAIPMWEWDYGHHAIVTTVVTENSHQETAWQRFTEDGPLAFLPLLNEAGENRCSIVWSTSPQHATELMELDDESFCQQLAQAFEHRLGNIIRTDQRHVFPLRQRHAQHYIKSGFVAIGDAAHTIHPLAGQGVNLGLLDAAQLAETLSLAMVRGEAYGSEKVLRRFQQARQSENLKMTAAMEAFKQMFTRQQPALRLLRNMGMNLLDRLSPIKQHIVQQAMGLGDNLPELAKRPIKD